MRARIKRSAEPFFSSFEKARDAIYREAIYHGDLGRLSRRTGKGLSRKRASCGSEPRERRATCLCALLWRRVAQASVDVVWGRSPQIKSRMRGMELNQLPRPAARWVS